MEDIGDGLNVLAAPNEAGKSTLFDGLQALLFSKSGSTAKEIRQLQPYAGGWPHIVADVEWDGGRYRIEKRFLGGSSTGSWISKPARKSPWPTRPRPGSTG